MKLLLRAARALVVAASAFGVAVCAVALVAGMTIVVLAIVADDALDRR